MSHGSNREAKLCTKKRTLASIVCEGRPQEQSASLAVRPKSMHQPRVLLTKLHCDHRTSTAILPGIVCNASKPNEISTILELPVL
jgi:hypothetical protein